MLFNEIWNGRVGCCIKRCIKYLHFFFAGLFLNNTFLRHTDSRKAWSHGWAYGFDSTMHDSNQYLKQSIKIMLGIRLWKYENTFISILMIMHIICTLIFLAKWEDIWNYYLWSKCILQNMTSFFDIWCGFNIKLLDKLP